MRNDLSDDEKQLLLEIARRTITEYITQGMIPQIPVKSAKLQAKRGCFVTLKQKGALRGCIGSFISEKPLHLLVQEMAVSAATRDPRFYPMKKSDLDSFELEISVLSPMQKIASVKEIVVGTHGIYIEKEHHRGVLLPQVATEYRWDRETFLHQTCLKAGLPPDGWQEEADIYIFSAQVF